MQKDFIEELENRSNQNINKDKDKITNLLQESDRYLMENQKTEKEVDILTEEAGEGNRCYRKTSYSWWAKR